MFLLCCIILNKRQLALKNKIKRIILLLKFLQTLKSRAGLNLWTNIKFINTKLVTVVTFNSEIRATLNKWVSYEHLKKISFKKAAEAN